MCKGYKNQEKRIKYLKNWRKKNREKCNIYLKDWFKRTGKKYYIPKVKIKVNKPKKPYKKLYKNKKFLGTCGIGRKYEKIALRLLRGSIDRNKYSFTGKWDIEWNGLKIDVKMRNLNKRNTWLFTTHKNPTADYYLCFCVKMEKIITIYFIPKEIFKTCLEISGKNKKYDKFILVLSQ